MCKCDPPVAAGGIFQQARQTRRRLEADEVLWGTFLVELEASGAIHVLAHAGLDFVIIDMEHGTYSPPQARRLIEASRAAPMACLVRVPLGDRGTVTKMLDAGADGILFPQVRTMEEVRQAVAMTKYPPLGCRGVHLFRPHLDFAPRVSAKQVFAEANASIITAIQIETPEAVELIDQIAGTVGVDMLYVGPGDLGALLCNGEDGDQAKINEVMERVGLACREHGKIAGCHVGSIESAAKWIPLGFRFFGAWAALRLLFHGAEAFIAQARQLSGPSQQEPS
ncbi:MAG: hypothetical protein JW741_09130 [Sedimentisphaerales bacterium]|nr:hypothetical protein [Sedimentisphaerales bacterium]